MRVDRHHTVFDGFSSNVVIYRIEVLDKVDYISRAVDLELDSEAIVGDSIILGHA
jgi:hypothetical protein